MHVIALSFIYLLCTVYYLCVCDYDAHECFVRSFFPKQAKQNQSSLVTRNILPPHISRSILLTCKGRVVTWLRVEKVCERKVFLCLFVLSTYFLVSWLVTIFICYCHEHDDSMSVWSQFVCCVNLQVCETELCWKWSCQHIDYVIQIHKFIRDSSMFIL